MGFFFTGDRGFESTSLQRRVCLSWDFIFVARTPAFRAGLCPCERRARHSRKLADPAVALRKAALQRVDRPFVLGGCRHSIHSPCFLCQSSIDKSG
jgi:hypothetical protein